MKTTADLLHRFTGGTNLIGGAFLIAGMLLLIGNIFGRFFNFVIPGSYELFELFMAIPVAIALVYAALNSFHVVVNLLISRFTPKLALISEIVTSLLSFITWGVIAYAGGQLACENGLLERSDILEVPCLPFRIVWISCLFIFSLICFSDFYHAMMRLFKK